MGDEKFKEWLKVKTLRDKSLEYLSKLNIQRAVKYESLLDVAISLCAVNRLVSSPGKKDFSSKPLKLLGYEEKVDNFEILPLNLVGSDIGSNQAETFGSDISVAIETLPVNYRNNETKSEGSSDSSSASKEKKLPNSSSPNESKATSFSPKKKKSQSVTNTSGTTVDEKSVIIKPVHEPLKVILLEKRERVQLIMGEETSLDILNVPPIDSNTDISLKSSLVSFIHVIPHVFSVGEKVECDATGEWLPCTIDELHSDGSVDVDYDNGDFKPRLSRDHIRKAVQTIDSNLQGEVTANATENIQYSIGDKVDGNYLGNAVWYPGIITFRHDDGYYDISYDDGDSESRVLPIYLRPRDATTSLSKFDNNDITPVVNNSNKSLRPRSRSSSPTSRPNSTWNPYFNMPKNRSLPMGITVRKGCTCTVPGYDCHKVGGCLFVALKTVPLDIANRPLFKYSKLCDCGGLCGCKSDTHEVHQKLPIEEVAEPVEIPVMVSFAIQTDDPPDGIDVEIQHYGPSMVDSGAQFDNAVTVQQSMQTDNPTSEKYLQTDNPISEQSIQHEGTLYMDQGCQTINFDKPRIKIGPQVPVDRRPPFVVKTVCSCAPKGADSSCACCNVTMKTSKPAPNLKPTKNAETVSIKNFWIKWVMEHHTFNNVVLTKGEINEFSGAVREFLVSPADVVSLSARVTKGIDYYDYHTGSVPLPSESIDKNTLPSLKYFMSDKNPSKSSGLIVKSLSADQRLQNKLFLRECKSLWKKANHVLNVMVIKYVVQAFNEIPEFNEKFQPNFRMLRRNEIKALYELSLKKLRLMLEEDEDMRQQDEKEKALEKLRESASSHEQFVRKKDSLRVRMPADLSINTVRPPFSFPIVDSNSNESNSSIHTANYDKAMAMTSAEMLSGLDLKFIHATNTGLDKYEGDLEKSKNQIRKLLRYRRERELRREQRQRENDMAFDDWLSVKDLKDQAIRALKVLKKPIIAFSDNSSSAGSESTVLSTVISMENATKEIPFSMDVLHYCKTIGERLKSIDRSLIFEWTEWSSGFLSPQVATALWDFFIPRACDIHSMYYSQTRDAFLKLLRPDIDYQEIIMRYADRHIFANQINQLKRERNVDNMTMADKKIFEVDLMEKKKSWSSETCLKKDDLVALLASCGITFSPPELEALIQAFDINDSEEVPLDDLLSFVGRQRDKKCGANMYLNQRCCFKNVCELTGMCNAFSVFTPTKRFLNKHSSAIVELQSGKKHFIQTPSGNIQLKILKTGKKVMSLELPERIKRVGLLTNLGLLKEASFDSKVIPLPQMASDEVNEESPNNNPKLAELPVVCDVPEQSNQGVVVAQEMIAVADGDYENDFEGNQEIAEAYGDDFEPNQETSTNLIVKREEILISPDPSPAVVDQKFEELENVKEIIPSPSIVGKDANEMVKNSFNDKSASRHCDFSGWTMAQRRTGLRLLTELTRSTTEEQKLHSLFASGKPPTAPKLWLSNTMQQSVDSKADYQQDIQLQLCWGPGKPSDLVSFYSLEFAGRVGIVGDIRYQEIFRDPEDASPDKYSVCTHGLNSLLPGASYYFRIRALNGFGSSEYTYKIFATLTAAPMYPLATKLSSHSVTLTWLFTKKFVSRFQSLRKLYHAAKDSSGKVPVSNLANLFEKHVPNIPELRKFINRVALDVGIDVTVNNMYQALFDRMELTEDGLVSWIQLEQFFFANNKRWNDGVNNTNNANASLRGFFGRSVFKVKPGEITYVLERCLSEKNDTYVEVARTSTGQATIGRLLPGSSYRFRLYSVNTDGISGPKSQSIIVHTLLDPPAAPIGIQDSIGPDRVTIQWRDQRNVNARPSDAIATEKLLDEWAGLHGENDNGLSIAAAFKHFDSTSSGKIDASQLSYLLKRLNVEPTSDRMAHAMSSFGQKGEFITYQQFHSWWYVVPCVYLLRRSSDKTDNVITTFTPSVNIAKLASINSSSDQPPQSPGMLKSGSSTVLSVLRSSNNSPSMHNMRMSRASLHSTVSSLSSGASTTSVGVDRLPAASVFKVPGIGMTPIPEEKSVFESLHRASAGFNLKRPSSAGFSQSNRTSREQLNDSVVMSQTLQESDSLGKESTDVVSNSVPVTEYLGPLTQLSVTGLTPNRIYHFRLRHIGSRSCSRFSEPLIILTKPLPPSAGIILDVSPTVVRVKWYPPKYGAVKFLVELKQLNIYRDNSDIMELSDEPWVAAYYGQESCWTSTILNPNTAYQLRVVAINAQDLRSEPSEVILFCTPSRDKPHDFFADTLKQKNALDSFTIECNGDICIGDVILITERLYLRLSDSALVSCNPAESKRFNREQIVYGTSGGADKFRNDIAESIQLPQATSARSIYSGGSSTTNAGTTFLGERTIAAMVLRDNYRILRDKLNLSGYISTNSHSVPLIEKPIHSSIKGNDTGPLNQRDIELNTAPLPRRSSHADNMKKFNYQRRLWLEVLWQQASNDACKPFELKPGDIVERKICHLEQFEVFRCRWREENKRRSLEEELDLLRECFNPSQP